MSEEVPVPDRSQQTEPAFEREVDPDSPESDETKSNAVHPGRLDIYIGTIAVLATVSGVGGSLLPDGFDASGVERTILLTLGFAFLLLPIILICYCINLTLRQLSRLNSRSRIAVSARRKRWFIKRTTVLIPVAFAAGLVLGVLGLNWLPFDNLYETVKCQVSSCPTPTSEIAEVAAEATTETTAVGTTNPTAPPPTAIPLAVTPNATPTETAMPPTATGASATAPSNPYDASLCGLPKLITQNEEGLFSVDGKLIGGPVRFEGERLWMPYFTSQGIMLFDTFQFDASNVVSDEISGFSIRVPEGMTARVTVDNSGAREFYFVMGGDRAEICGEFAVVQMTLFTEPLSWNADQANQWQRLDHDGSALADWSPIPQDDELLRGTAAPTTISEFTATPNVLSTSTIPPSASTATSEPPTEGSTPEPSLTEVPTRTPPDSTPTEAPAQEPVFDCNIDSIVLGYESEGGGAHRLEIGGGGTQIVSIHPAPGVSPVTLIVPPREPFIINGYGRMWEGNGPGCDEFDWITFARDNMNAGHSGILVDMRTTPYEVFQFIYIGVVTVEDMLRALNISSVNYNDRWTEIDVYSSDGCNVIHNYSLDTLPEVSTSGTHIRVLFRESSGEPWKDTFFTTASEGTRFVLSQSLEGHVWEYSGCSDEHLHSLIELGRPEAVGVLYEGYVEWRSTDYFKPTGSGS